MGLMFKATFSLSEPLMLLINNWLIKLKEVVGSFGLPDILSSFLSEGVLGGVGLILSFVPLIFILFFLMALLEDSGYLSRTVVLVDRLFAKFGISGQSFVPMILGFGCNVPAIMATRIIKNERERKIAIFVNSFVSCGARLPVYALFASVFFPKSASLVIMSLYLFGVVVAFGVSFILSVLMKSEEKSGLIVELPPYRWPTFKSVYRHAWFQVGLFVKKASGVILVAMAMVWLLALMPYGVEYGSRLSWLGQAGELISPIFEPLGFGHWAFGIALLTGVVAKEVIIGSLGVLLSVGGQSLLTALPSYITPAGAVAFMVFVLLYTPCLPTIAVMKKETGSWKFVVVQMMLTFVIAWLMAFGVYGLWG